MIVTRTIGFLLTALAVTTQGGLATKQGFSSVSVCQDATYSVPTSRGAVCSGSGPQPLGHTCPLKGDQATDNCHPYHSTYKNGVCIAGENAQCTLVDGKTWGCTFPGHTAPSYVPSPAPETYSPSPAPVKYTPAPTPAYSKPSYAPSPAPETYSPSYAPSPAPETYSPSPAPVKYTPAPVSYGTPTPSPCPSLVW